MIDIKNIKRTEYSVTEPVTLTEVKTHLHITDSDNDTELTALITQCRQAIEEFCAVSIVNTRIILTACFGSEWELPYGPVTGIEYVGTKDISVGSGIPGFTTLDEGWEVLGEDLIKFSTNLPSVHKIQYTAGYQDVPDKLKLAILNEIYFRYENKGQTGLSVCKEAQELASSYRRLWI